MKGLVVNQLKSSNGIEVYLIFIVLDDNGSF